MEKITYGVPSLLDWVAEIKTGAATLKVHFTGGALTSYGVTPAEYTTSNPFIQRVIEQSAYFKKGRITVLRRVKLPGAVPQELETGKGQQLKLHTKTDVYDAHPASKQNEAKDEVADKPEKEDNSLTKVKASCLQDAQAYLQEHFNISSYKVRSYETAQKVALEHGFLFEGEKFDTVNGACKAEKEASE